MGNAGRTAGRDSHDKRVMRHRWVLRHLFPLLAVVLLGVGLPSASVSGSDPVAPAQPFSCSSDAGSTVRVAHAGSLANLVSGTLFPAFKELCGASGTETSGPSVLLADEIKNGAVTADVFLSAGAGVNQQLLGPRNGNWEQWFLVFARNEMVITYTPQSRFFPDLEKARLGQLPWYQVLTEPGFVLGRSDPNQDPGGYYAVMVGQLAERYYGIPGLKQRLLGSDTNPAQIVPGPAFTTTVNGAIPDARFGYLSSVLDQKQNYIVLPRQINLGDPTESALYAKASFTNTDGFTYRGGPIRFSATLLKNSAAPQTALDFIRLLISEQGQAFATSRDFLASPILVGGDASALPAELRPFVTGCFEATHCTIPDDQHVEGEQ